MHSIRFRQLMSMRVVDLNDCSLCVLVVAKFVRRIHLVLSPTYWESTITRSMRPPWDREMDIYELVGKRKDEPRHSGSSTEDADKITIKTKFAIKHHPGFLVRLNHC